MSSKNLDFFLNDPKLLKRHLQALPTEEMYRYFPPKEEVITIDKSDPKNNYRYIFNGQQKTQFEQQKFYQLKEYESRTGNIDYPPSWLESDTMRLLQASEFDIKKTYTTIKENIEWLNTIPKDINDKIIHLLNSGFLYVHGRDRHFRPIIIVSVKMVKVIISQNYTFDDISQAIIYLTNYVIKYLLIPGQIENWIVIVDFDDVGLSDIGEFKKILSTLSKQRGRVFKDFFVNISGLIKISIKTAVKVFSSVAKKLIILGPNELNKIQEIISPENIEKKYGGLANDVIPGDNNLFPPIMPSSIFVKQGEKNINIVTPEAYKEMCLNSNPYKPFVICPKYEEMWKKEEEEKKKLDFKKKSLTIENSNKLLLLQTLNCDSNKENNKKLNEKLKPKTYVKKPNNLIEINEFLREFEGYNMLENLEERKYSVPSSINIEEIDLFFNGVKENQNFFQFE